MYRKSIKGCVRAYKQLQRVVGSVGVMFWTRMQCDVIASSSPGCDLRANVSGSRCPIRGRIALLHGVI